MKRLVVVSLLVAGAALPARGTDLNVSVKSQGSNVVTVAPGAPVVYQVTGVLGDIDNQGLAAVAFDLAFSGGDLPPASTPASNPMASFVAPSGLNNPAGYGGTIIEGALVEIGGMQNVMNNTPAQAPAPIGAVILGVAQTPVVLATGSFVAPAIEDTYALQLSNLVGAVIRLGEDGIPSWGIAPTEPGAVGDLTLVVSVNAPAGAVPGGATMRGMPLRLGKAPGGGIVFSWGASCSTSDSDYAIYRGDLGFFTSHVPLACTTSGARTITVTTPIPGNAYFLVVPRTPYREGSYGTDSSTNERPPSASACVPRSAGACQ